MIDFYVYVYTDPRTNLPFYVGKGSLNRYKEHLYKSHNLHVRSKVAVIRESGLEPRVDKVLVTKDEDTAYTVEAFLIAQYGLRDKGGLLCNHDLGGKGTRKVLYDDEFYERLGKESDLDIAVDYSCTRHTVGAIRRSLGIPTVLEKGIVKHKNATEVPEECLAALGTVPDTVLSEIYGVNNCVIGRLRNLKGIPPYRKERLPKEYMEMLGKVPDSVIEELTGVTRANVNNIRNGLGIPSFRSQGGGCPRIRDKRVYLFENTHTGEVVEGTREFIIDKIGTTTKAITKVLSNRDRKIKRLWKFIGIKDE